MLMLIVTLVLIGLGLYLIETYVPMAPPLRLILRIVVIIAVVLWLLRLFGIGDIPIPQVR